MEYQTLSLQLHFLRDEACPLIKEGRSKRMDISTAGSSKTFGQPIPPSSPGADLGYFWTKHLKLKKFLLQVRKNCLKLDFQGIKFIRIMQLSLGVLPSHKCFNEQVSPIIRIYHLLFIIREHTFTTSTKNYQFCDPSQVPIRKNEQ